MWCIEVLRGLMATSISPQHGHRKQKRPSQSVDGVPSWPRAAIEGRNNELTPIFFESIYVPRGFGMVNASSSSAFSSAGIGPSGFSTAGESI